MASTVPDLLTAARKALQNVAAAQESAHTIAVQIARERGAQPPPGAFPAAPPAAAAPGGGP
jgi:hypothetical protein